MAVDWELVESLAPELGDLARQIVEEHAAVVAQRDRLMDALRRLDFRLEGFGFPPASGLNMRAHIRDTLRECEMASPAEDEESSSCIDCGYEPCECEVGYGPVTEAEHELHAPGWLQLLCGT